MVKRPIILLLAAMAMAVPPSAFAEPQVVGPMLPEHFTSSMPVDQAVGDLDPLARSLRYLEPGNALHSGRVRLHQIPPHASEFAVPGLETPHTYRFSAPGVQAMFDRPDYVTRTGPGRRDFARNVASRPDGAFTELVPAGTVYDLRPEAALRHLNFHEYVDVPSDWEDTRIDHRYRIDGRVSGHAFGRPAHAPPDTPIPSRIPRRFDPDAPADGGDADAGPAGDDGEVTAPPKGGG